MAGRNDGRTHNTTAESELQADDNNIAQSGRSRGRGRTEATPDTAQAEAETTTADAPPPTMDQLAEEVAASLDLLEEGGEPSPLAGGVKAVFGIIENFAPGVAGSAVPFIQDTFDKGQKYGFNKHDETVLITPAKKDKDGNSKPQILSDLLSAVSYTGEGQLEISQDLLNIAKAILQVIGVEPTDESAIDMVVGVMSFAMEMVGMEMPKPGSPSPTTLFGEAADPKDLDPKTIVLVDALSDRHTLFALISQSDAQVDQGLILTLGAVLERSGLSVPDAFADGLANGMTNKEFVEAYAAAGSQLTQGIDVPEDLLTAAKETLNTHGIEDPDGSLAKGLSVLAANSPILLEPELRVLDRIFAQEEQQQQPVAEPAPESTPEPTPAPAP